MVCHKSNSQAAYICTVLAFIVLYDLYQSLLMFFKKLLHEIPACFTRRVLVHAVIIYL